jgi:hypothetical protein
MEREISRRDFLIGSLKLGAVTAAAVPLGSVLLGEGTASGAGLSPVFGTNSLQWQQVNAALGGRIPGVRSSVFGTNGVPHSWTKYTSEPHFQVQSFNPDIKLLLAGKLDGALRQYARTVPAGQAVTAWHEAECRHRGLSWQTVQAIQSHAHKVLKSENPHLRYVQIVAACSYYYRSDFKRCLSPHVDALYMDAYQTKARPSIAETFGAPLKAMRQAVGSHMHIGIAETNSNIKANRPAWFSDAWRFACDEGFGIMFTYWRKPILGRTAHIEWDPHDAATIKVLRGIVKQSRR